ncbi:MAG: hypothetical protein AAB724_03160, partial [Patescibacteria group bacterium]
ASSKTLGIIRFLIELLEDGNININGPLENKVLCYGLLEMGKVLVTNYENKKVISGKEKLPQLYFLWQRFFW